MSKTGKALTSKVWKYFEKVGLVDEKEKCKCMSKFIELYSKQWNNTFNES
jgi:hypothetical protein